MEILMKLLTFLSIFTLFSLTTPGLALGMESTKPVIPFEEYQVLDFNPERDMPEIYPMFQADWDHLYVGKPYDPSIVDAIMQVVPDSSKSTKVLRYLEKTIAFINYYKNPKQLYLDTGALARPYQRLGILTHFMPALLKEAQAMDADHLNIYVEKTNEGMLKVCNRFGFEIVNDQMFKGKAYELKKFLKK